MTEKTYQPGPDHYDRTIGALDGLPDVLHTKLSNIRNTEPVVGNSRTYLVQTYRQTDIGDTVFIEYVGPEGHTRLVLPPRVADTIARQRDALTKLAQRKNGRRIAQERKDRGEQPGFMKAVR